MLTMLLNGNIIQNLDERTIKWEPYSFAPGGCKVWRKERWSRAEARV